jgi:hypothetical protein
VDGFKHSQQVRDRGFGLDVVNRRKHESATLAENFDAFTDKHQISDLILLNNHPYLAVAKGKKRQMGFCQSG